jgi:ABC-2 type transport system permease protein
MTGLSTTKSLGLVPTIAGVTFRQLVGRRRALLLLLLCAVPVLVALMMRGADVRDVDAAAGGVLDRLIVGLILPIVAVLFGTAAFGAEIEDGTIVYLLAKPVPRWAIVAAKILAAVGATAALTVGSVALSSLIAITRLGDEATRIAEVYLLATAVGSICYVAVFVALSLFTRRALMIGFAYVLIWEGTLSSLLPGIANLSIRQYALGVGQLVTKVPSSWGAELEPETAVPLAVIVVVAATVLATRRLMRLEISGETD